MAGFFIKGPGTPASQSGRGWSRDCVSQHVSSAVEASDGAHGGGAIWAMRIACGFNIWVAAPAEVPPLLAELQALAAKVSE
jgi:hypothetical protein